MKDMPTSYRDENGDLIFVYCPETNDYAKWYVARRRKSKGGGYNVGKVQDEGLRTRMTEAECRTALHEYAKKKGYEPAY